MAFTSHKGRCQLTAALFISLIVLQLILVMVAEANRRNYQNVRTGKLPNRKRNQRPRIHDSPRLFNHSRFQNNQNRIYTHREGHRLNNNYRPNQLPVEDQRDQPQQQPQQQQHQHPLQVPTSSPDIIEEDFEAEFEARKRYRIEQIKETILEKLNLGSAPNVTGMPGTSNPQVLAMIDEVNIKASETSSRLNHSEYVQDAPVQRKAFIPMEENYPFNYRIPDGMDVMYFKMNPGQISAADLHLWIKPAVVTASDKILLTAFKVLKPASENDLIRLEQTSQSLETVSGQQGAWTTLPVSKAVSDWVSDPSNNLGLVVEMKDHSGKQIALTNAKDIPTKAPLLEVWFLHEGHSNRTARSPHEGGKCSMGETRCCRFPLPIHFTEYNFDFIVAPKIYMANFCSGKCPYLYAQQAIHQTVVQKIKLHNITATYGPCCGAKELMPLNMLYYDHDQKIRFDVINDMVIESCSCD